MKRYLLAGAAATVSVLANCPRDAGTLKPHIADAGFPQTFARWIAGQLVMFDVLACVVDAVVAAALVGAACFAAGSTRITGDTG